jgi:hypothetical protein
MSAIALRRVAALVLPIVLCPACTLVAIDSQSGPPGIRADGLIEGHVAFGIRDEHQLLHVDLFDGTSCGAIFELRLWKLARIEIGLAGAALGLGPVDLALGCLFYEPEIPRFVRRAKREHHHHAVAEADHDDGEVE